MPDKKKRLQQLFRLYLENKIDAADYDAFWDLLESDKDGKAIADDLQSLWEHSVNENDRLQEEAWQIKMNTLIAEAEGHPPVAKKKRNFRWVAAAAVTVLFSAGLYFCLPRNHGDTKTITHVEKADQQRDIQPGGNKATLTLANGAKIMLDSTANGWITHQGYTKILKLNNGQLTYQNEDHTPQKVVYNTLTTPRGGKYQITLPDGSEVWLNAASSIKFPTAFTGPKRAVDLYGEAYFEIVPDKSKAFEVTVNGLKVQVLGTHFNVMAYPDENTVNTTLLEGSVKILNGNMEVLLKPGQQAQVNKKGEINLVPDVDTERITAWKNNLFWFDHEDIRSVMRQLSRWYDMDIQIQGNILHHFSGTLPRDVNASKVFDVLEQTGGIHFKVDHQKIIVSP